MHGGEGASQGQPQVLTNASPVPGPVAIRTADTPVGARGIDTLRMGARAGIHALVDICQETKSLQAPLGCPLQLEPQSPTPRQGCQEEERQPLSEERYSALHEGQQAAASFTFTLSSGPHGKALLALAAVRAGGVDALLSWAGRGLLTLISICNTEGDKS